MCVIVLDLKMRANPSEKRGWNFSRGCPVPKLMPLGNSWFRGCRLFLRNLVGIIPKNAPAAPFEFLFKTYINMLPNIFHKFERARQIDFWHSRTALTILYVCAGSPCHKLGRILRPLCLELIRVPHLPTGSCTSISSSILLLLFLDIICYDTVHTLW
jgi:hypothetical protein